MLFVGCSSSWVYRWIGSECDSQFQRLVRRIGLPFGKAPDGQETQEQRHAAPFGGFSPLYGSAGGRLDGTCDLVPSGGRALLYGASDRHHGSLGEDAYQPPSQAGDRRSHRAPHPDNIPAYRLVRAYTGRAGALRRPGDHCRCRPAAEAPTSRDAGTIVFAAPTGVDFSRKESQQRRRVWRPIYCKSATLRKPGRR